jgi:putative nucleotidyltransferase with HDIG domain
MSVGRDFDGLVSVLRGADDLTSALRAVMTPGRWRHSEAAGRLAGDLAARYRCDEAEIVRRAALLHDVGRTLPPEALAHIVDWGGWPPDEYERAAGPALIHGPAGAAVAAALGLANEAAAAIRFHVAGREGLTLTDKIVMAADAAEKTRPYPWAEAARRALDESLDLCVAFWVTLKSEQVRAAGRAVHPRSRQTLASLGQEVTTRARLLAAPFL